MQKILMILLISTIGVTFAPLSLAQQKHTYYVVSTYPIVGAEKWDYLALDTQRHHLFISRSHHVQVVDMQTGAVVGDIPNTEGVHGIAIDPEDGLGFTTNGKSQSVTVFQLTDFRTIATIKVTGAEPDAILYLPELKQVYTFNGDGHNITVIDAPSHTFKKTIVVGATPEFGVSDRQGRVFFNIEDKHQIGVIDTKSDSMLHRWNLPNCSGPTGLALDPASHRLFSSCQNHQLVVTDAITGRHVTAVHIGENPDGVIFNPHTRQILVSNGDGTLNVINQYSPSHYKVIQSLGTRELAKTMTYDSQTQRVYMLGGRVAHNTSRNKVVSVAANDASSVNLLVLLLRPDEVLSGILDAPVLEVTHDAFRILFQHHHMSTGCVA
jgi:DNA-binding beta-propeller fold protein YncE